MLNHRRDGNGSKRLNREKWLRAALDTLNDKGIDYVKVLPLAKELGVTRGSFYWHFRDRDDLLRQMLEFWESSQTDEVISRVTANGGTPREQLRLLGQDVLFRKYNRYEVAVRAWAMADTAARRAVRRVDRKRLKFVSGLLASDGVDADEAWRRAQTIIGYLIVEPEFNSRLSRKGRLDNLDAVLDLML